MCSTEALNGWIPLNLPHPDELRLQQTLLSAQSFRWRRYGSDPTEWVGVIGRRVVLLKETPTDVLFKAYSSSTTQDPEAKQEITTYFRLDTHSLLSLYKEWASKDARFAEIASMNGPTHLRGLRLIRANPVEAFFTFICSQNTNVQRITTMVETLAKKYGDHIATLDGTEYHAFPSVAQLTKADEKDLRAWGFGYRARYIVEAAKELHERGGESWLVSLRGKPHKEVQQQLVQFIGIGPKVADCIALSSLDCFTAIPVDTHVWQIAVKYYLPHLKNKSLTKAYYDKIGEVFYKQFGALCGWAHSVMFAAELKLFTPGKRKHDDSEEDQAEAGETNTSDGTVPSTDPSTEKRSLMRKRRRRS